MSGGRFPGRTIFSGGASRLVADGYYSAEFPLPQVNEFRVFQSFSAYCVSGRKRSIAAATCWKYFKCGQLADN